MIISADAFAGYVLGAITMIGGVNGYCVALAWLNRHQKPKTWPMPKRLVK